MNRGVECKYCQHTENEYVIYCKLHKEELQQYKCTKGQCKDCVFPTLAEVIIPIGRCDNCPFVVQKRTMGAGYAFDYFCGALKNGNNKIAGYVEYDNEIPPVPNWCPFRKKGI